MSEHEQSQCDGAQTPTQEPAAPKKQPRRSRSQARRSQNSVFQYITILFAAAFVLLLMTYMMQQRLNKAQIDDLEQISHSTLQSLENIISERDQLRSDKEELSDELDDALQTAKNSTELAKEQAKALEAMDWFWRIQRQFSRGYTRDAKELAQEFEARGLAEALPDTSYAQPDGPSPKQQYEELRKFLF